jgi:hypothetical protein
LESYKNDGYAPTRNKRRCQDGSKKLIRIDAQEYGENLAASLCAG